MADHLTDKDCEAWLESSYPNHPQANDGDLWECSCCRVWEHVCDEAEGCYWILFSRNKIGGHA